MTAEKTLDKPLEMLNTHDLVEELIELEAMAEEVAREIAAARAELKERMKIGEPYDHIVKVDGEDRMGMTIRVQRTRGAHRWKYNPKMVMNHIREKGYNGFITESLDTKTFNQALSNNEDMALEFSAIVRSEYDDDRLVVKGLKEVLEKRRVE